MAETYVQNKCIFLAAFVHKKFLDFMSETIQFSRRILLHLVIWHGVMHSSLECHLYNLTKIIVQGQVTQIYAKTS